MVAGCAGACACEGSQCEWVVCSPGPSVARATFPPPWPRATASGEVHGHQASCSARHIPACDCTAHDTPPFRTANPARAGGLTTGAPRRKARGRKPRRSWSTTPTPAEATRQTTCSSTCPIPRQVWKLPSEPGSVRTLFGAARLEFTPWNDSRPGGHVRRPRACCYQLSHQQPIWLLISSDLLPALARVPRFCICVVIPVQDALFDCWLVHELPPRSSSDGGY